MGQPNTTFPINPVKYRAGYKYHLDEDWEYQTSIIGHDVATDGEAFVSLDFHGVLRIRAGYAWDGPSVPVIDSKDIVRGGLAHDALHQLIRDGKLPEVYRGTADQILKDICSADGMSSFRAWYLFWSVGEFSSQYAEKQNAKVRTAP